MAVPLRILILEDEPADAELAVHTSQGGLRAGLERVDTEKDYVRCLEPLLCTRFLGIS